MLRRLTRNLLTLLSIFTLVPCAGTELEPATQLFTSGNFSDTSRAVTLLIENGHEDSEKLLTALLNGRPYYRKKDKQIVLVQKQGSKYQLIEPSSGEDLGLVSKRKLKKISINNKLRKQIKAGLSLLRLTNPDAEVRLDAVESLMTETDADILTQLRSIQSKESDQDIIDAIGAVLAYDELKDLKTQAKHIVV